MKSLSFTLDPTPVSTPTPTTPNSPAVSLHQLVDRLMKQLTPLAVKQHSFIINDVEETFELNADEQVLNFIVDNLMNNAILCTHNACIRIEAIKNPKGIIIKVKNNGANFHSTVSNGFAKVVAAAKSVGGNINIYNQRHEGTVITLSMAA